MFDIKRQKYMEKKKHCVNLVKNLEEVELQLDQAKEKVLYLKRRRNEIEKLIYYEMRDMPIGSAIKGTKLFAVIHKKIVCSIIDWPTLIHHVEKFKRYELINKSVDNTSYNRFIKSGELVPGSEPYKKLGIKLIEDQYEKNKVV